MKITILAKSSSGNKPYSVDFVFKDKQMSIFCNCPAGKFRNFCQHKWGLINGNYDLLYNRTQNEELDHIHEWVQNSKYLDLIKGIDEARAKLKEARRRAAIAMKNGLGK